jgi:hypothetical protein
VKSIQVYPREVYREVYLIGARIELHRLAPKAVIDIIDFAYRRDVAAVFEGYDQLRIYHYELGGSSENPREYMSSPFKCKVTKTGCILGCSTFNKKETAKIREWALAGRKKKK